MMRKLFLSTVLLVLFRALVWSQSGLVYEACTLKSEVLGMKRNYSIYLPAGYNESDQHYPVLYLLHGSGDNHTGWVQFGQVQHLADRTIADGLAARMIIVMPDADTGRRGYFNDIRGDFNYEDFFFDELIPHIEATYRVRSDRRYRAVAGLSMGGGGSIFYALHRPHLFAAAAPLSAATGNWSFEQMKNRLGEAGAKASAAQLDAFYKRHSVEGVLQSASNETLDQIRKVRWYISCGDDDFLYEGNSLLHIAFKKADIAHEYRVKDGAHTWTYWRMELPLVMAFVSQSFTQY